MSHWTERLYPFVGAVVATLLYAYFKFWQEMQLVSNLESVMQVVVVFSGIFIGFVSTSKSLLFAIPDRPFVNRVRKAGGFTLLLSYFLSAIRSALMLSGLSDLLGRVLSATS